MSFVDVFVFFIVFVCVMFIVAYASAAVLLHRLKQDNWLTPEDLEDIDK